MTKKLQQSIIDLMGYVISVEWLLLAVQLSAILEQHLHFVWLHLKQPIRVVGKCTERGLIGLEEN